MFVCFPAFWKLRHHIFIQARGASMCTLTAKAACFCWAITPVPTLNCTSSYTSPGSSAKLNSLKCVCCFYCAPQTARSHTIQIFLPGSIFFLVLVPAIPCQCATPREDSSSSSWPPKTPPSPSFRCVLQPSALFSTPLSLFLSLVEAYFMLRYFIDYTGFARPVQDKARSSNMSVGVWRK